MSSTTHSNQVPEQDRLLELSFLNENTGRGPHKALGTDQNKTAYGRIKKYVNTNGKKSFVCKSDKRKKWGEDLLLWTKHFSWLPWMLSGFPGCYGYHGCSTFPGCYGAGLLLCWCHRALPPRESLQVPDHLTRSPWLKVTMGGFLSSLNVLPNCKFS